MSIEGIDISRHQPSTPPLGTVGFVFVRATYGLTPDDRYSQHAVNVRAAGKVLGAYHFGRQSDGAAQARAFLNVIGPQQRLVALDFEKDGANGHMTPDQARAFIRTVQATGRTCGLYASASGYPDLGQSWKWIAKWNSTPPSGLWAFWQWASGSQHPSGLDRDRFSGSETALRRMAGLLHWEWIRKPSAGQTEAPFFLFTVKDGRITSRKAATTGGTHQPCTPPHTYPWPGHVSKSLVRLTGDWHHDAYVHARWAKEV